jgi:hypothetical protein
VLGPTRELTYIFRLECSKICDCICRILGFHRGGYEELSLLPASLRFRAWLSLRLADGATCSTEESFDLQRDWSALYPRRHNSSVIVCDLTHMKNLPLFPNRI